MRTFAIALFGFTLCLTIDARGQAPPAPPPDEGSIEAELLQLCDAQGFIPGVIPDGLFSEDEIDPLGVAVEWVKIQAEVEKLLQRRLKLQDPPKLPLLLATVDEGKDTERLRFLFPYPGDDRVVDALVRSVGTPEGMFDKSVRLVGETVAVELDDFQDQFMRDGRPHLVRIKAALQKMLQGDSKLSKLAKEAGGNVTPIDIPKGLQDHKLVVQSDWQKMRDAKDFRQFWRIRITLERKPEDYWDLQSLIEFGEQLRTQARTQIRVIANSNQLSGFYVDETRLIIPGHPEIKQTRVRYRDVTADKHYMAPETKSRFGRMAPALWTQVTATLLKGREGAK